MAIHVVSAAATSRTTTTSTTYQLKLSQAVSVTSGKTYALFWHCQLDIDSITPNLRARLQDTTGATTLAESIIRCDPTTQVFPCGGLALYTAASTTTITFEIQFSLVSDTATVGCQGAQLVVFELESGNDFWNSSAGNSTRTSTTYSSKVAVTANPGASSDFLVCAAWQGETELQTKINDGTSDILLHDRQDYVNVDQYWSGFWFTKRTIASSTTFDLLAASASGTSNIREAYILVLDLAKFAGNIFGSSLTEGSSTTTTYATRATVTASVNSGNHLVLASAIQYGGTGAETSKFKMRVESSDVGVESIQRTDGTTYKFFWFGMSVENLTAGSRTVDTQWARNSGAGTHNILSNVVAALELAAAAGGTLAALPPDTILASTNLTGVSDVTNIDDDPDSPDANWATATSATAATDLRVGFPTPGA